MRRKVASMTRGANPDRLWAMTVVNPTTACWEWMGNREEWGYGRFGVCGRSVLTHRYAWTLTHGAIPPGMLVLHRCDVRHCVNPDHLFLGTNADNMADMKAKGRGRALRGESHPGSKLNEAAIRQMRAMRAAGAPQRAIAESFGVSEPVAVKAMRGLSYSGRLA